ncbi:hypothetical protein Droror1_Dr00016799 [Drosera rotundifolia]
MLQQTAKLYSRHLQASHAMAYIGHITHHLQASNLDSKTQTIHHQIPPAKLYNQQNLKPKIKEALGCSRQLKKPYPLLWSKSLPGSKFCIREQLNKHPTGSSTS